MHINSISSKVNGQTHTIYVGSDNINITQGSDTDDIIRELFTSFLRNYEWELTIIKGSNFVFESFELMDYKLQRKRLRRCGSYIKSPEWLLHKGSTINQKNRNDGDACRGQ